MEAENVFPSANNLKTQNYPQMSKIPAKFWDIEKSDALKSAGEEVCKRQYIESLDLVQVEIDRNFE